MQDVSIFVSECLYLQIYFLMWGGGGCHRGSTSLIPNFFKTSHLPDEINASLKLPGFACNDRRARRLTAWGLGVL